LGSGPGEGRVVRRVFFSSRRRHTGWPRDWSSDVCSSDLRSRTASGAVLVPEAVRERLVRPNGLAVLERHKHDTIAGLKQGRAVRSEERRVGKGCRWRLTARHETSKVLAWRVGDDVLRISQ